MKDIRYVVVAVLVIVAGLRLWRRTQGKASRGIRLRRPTWLPEIEATSTVALVARREMRERFRSRMFRIGTIVVLAVVVVAIIVPVIDKGRHHPTRVGVVGALSTQIRQTVVADGASVGVTAVLVDEPDAATADQELGEGKISLVIVGARRLVVEKGISPSDTSSGALFVRLVATSVSRQAGIEAVGISPEEAARLANPAPLPVTSLKPAPAKKTRTTEKSTAVYGLILVYVLLTQYGTWIMLGVVEEKSSRVVEVLLSAMRPGQLLAGKVIGIGTVALTQAALLVAVALGLAAAVGSDLVQGAAPTQVLSILFWLLLGYGLYCWVYAAGGSLADRQEHVQALAFPMQIPILFGYISSLVSIGASTPSTLEHVLAYVPFTAPFAMNVLVADGSVTWWQYLLSAAVTVAATVAVARLATTIYRRAVLRTGRRVKLSEVLAAG